MEFAYRFQYADGSAFEIFADGRAEIVFKDGRREHKQGVIINRIPTLIAQASVPQIPKGCICPPTSELTCKSLFCGRGGVGLMPSS